MVISLAVLWSGFLIVSWGRHMLAGDDVGIADLAIPGHYAKTPRAGSTPAQPITSTAPPPGGSGGGGGAHGLL